MVNRKKGLWIKFNQLVEEGLFRDCSYAHEDAAFGVIKQILNNQGYTVEKVIDEVAYKAKVDIVRKEKINRILLYKADLFDDFGVSDEVGNHIYDKAYEDGHAYGYESIENHFEELYNFIRQCPGMENFLFPDKS